MLSELIAAYLKNKADEKLSKFDKETAKLRKSVSAAPDQLAELEVKRNLERFKLEENLQPTNWLTDAAKRAKQISIATHALKFTHTDAKGSSICNMSYYGDHVWNNSYLNTATLRTIPTDIVGNAAALDVAKLLQIEHEGESLIAFISRGDSSPLRPFATSEIQLSEWMNGFLQVLQPKVLSSHTLAKQIYFPINDTEYHLLSPLFASSLAQAFFNRIHHNRYSESAKKARKAKRENKFSTEIITHYPDLMVQTFGGTKPQNVSQLNSVRGGKTYLFNCAPPTWNSNIKAPRKDFINKYFDPLVKTQIKDLKNFLLSMNYKNRNKNKANRDQRFDHVEELINSLLFYAAQIQDLPPGWSAFSTLPENQQLWLDPGRAEIDEEFKKKFKKMEWMEEITKEFARWLNQKLRHKYLNMGDPEYNSWRKQLLEKLVGLREKLGV